MTGPWFIAAFDSDCSWGDEIFEGDEIRADGEGGWEHRECVDEDDEPDPTDANAFLFR